MLSSKLSASVGANHRGTLCRAGGAHVAANRCNQRIEQRATPFLYSLLEEVPENCTYTEVGVLLWVLSWIAGGSKYLCKGRIFTSRFTSWFTPWRVRVICRVAHQRWRRPYGESDSGASLT